MVIVLLFMIVRDYVYCRFYSFGIGRDVFWRRVVVFCGYFVVERLRVSLCFRVRWFEFMV